MKHVPLLAALVAAGSSTANAEPLRLRGDALATTASPAGLLTLEATGSQSRELSAEAVVWMAGQPAPGEDTRGDVLVIALRAREIAHEDREREDERHDEYDDPDQGGEA